MKFLLKLIRLIRQPFAHVRSGRHDASRKFRTQNIKEDIMPLTINTNMAASRASYFLSKNNDALQKSLDRLSSGRKNNPAS